MAEIYIDTNTLRASDYMTPDYIARHGGEPSIQQKVERLNIAVAQRNLEDEIKAAYPQWKTKPVAFRMNNTGVVLHMGFDTAFRTIARGDAELVK